MKRTSTQNRSMWLYFTRLAEALNESGYELKKLLCGDLDTIYILANDSRIPDEIRENLLVAIDALTTRKKVDIPWNKQTVHDLLWIPIQKAMTGTDSTTELESPDPREIYEVLNRHLAQKFGISVRWPSEEL